MAAEGFVKLDMIIERLRRLDVARDIAPDVAKALDAELRAQIAAGQAPDGTPWQKTKSGKVPLTGAGKNLTVTADGTRIVAQLTGPEARHHLGAVKGGIRRQILPSRGLGQPVIKAIRTALGKAWGDLWR